MRCNLCGWMMFLHQMRQSDADKTHWFCKDGQKCWARRFMA